MANEALPLHMREFDDADEDAPSLPMYTVTDSSQSSENTIVDSVNDVQAGPDICMLFSCSTSFTELTLY